MPSNKDLAKIHIAKKKLSLTDEVYRDILRERFGKESAKYLTPRQAFQLIEHFRSLGWKQKSGKKKESSYTIPTDGQEAKIVALWLELHKAKVVRDKSDKALQSFVETVTECNHMRWCTPQQKSNIIEALKDMAVREGVELD